MDKKVIIARDEQGQYSVGEMGAEAPMEPGAALMGGEQEGPQMQPAPNLDAALDMAAALLESDPEAEAEGEQGLEAGFKKGMGYQEVM